MTFGRYTLLRQLAIGGMAEIYLARVQGIEKFAKQVVLKRILPQYARSEEFVQMFLHEARLAATLQHPNIVQVFDIGEVDGTYFFTMEYVHGDDLRSLLKAVAKRDERIPINHAIAIVAEAAAGLHHAHEQVDEAGKPLAIVHRDVSPSNIMVSFDGAVKVADFGIAKAASQTVETRTGMLKGKVTYMSPEQCRGDELDRRSDVFALGIVLHELVTGRKVYKGDNDYAIIRKIIEEDAPRVSTIVDGLPDGLEAIVARALARDRDDRYPTAQALQVELEALAREHKLDSSSVGRSRYLRQILGTPPAGVPIEPSITIEPGSAASGTSAPTSVRRAPTDSTALETPSVRRARRAWWIGGASVAVAGTIATVLAVRSGGDVPETLPPAPVIRPVAAGSATPPPTPAVARTVDPPPVGIDAGVAPDPVPVKKPPKGTPPKKAPPVKTPPKSDPCRGWTSSSFEPPPPGCDPTKHGD